VLGCIVADAQRSTEVIRSFRAMFSGRNQPESQIDANDLIRETVALTRAELEATRVTLMLNLASELPRVPAHRAQVQQVILNLVNNALDAMRGVSDREAVLGIASGRSASNGVELVVSDNGSGIDQGNVERIFDAFFTTKPNGMGMGLAICRTIIEAHGGTLAVFAQQPHGSAFRLSLPGAAGAAR
jgi:signal transduction histidine kinase